MENKDNVIQFKTHLKEILIKSFKDKGYSIKDYFFLDIFFLQEDFHLNSFLKQKNIKLSDLVKSKTTSTNRLLIKNNSEKILVKHIISNLTEINEELISKNTSTEEFISFLNTNYEKKIPIRFEVCTFINEVCEKIMESKNIHDRCRYINQVYNISSVSPIIEKKLYEMKELLLLNDETIKITHNHSSMNINIESVDKLPEGEYSFKLNIKEIDDEFLLVNYEKSTLSNKKILIEVPSKIINDNQSNKDFIFHSIFLHNINHSKIKEFISKGNKIKLKNKVKNQSFTPKIERNTNSNSIKKLTPIKNNLDSVQPQIKEFDLLIDEDFQLNTQPSSISYNFSENSGSNILEFGIIVKRNGREFGKSKESLLDFFLIHIDNILHSSDNNCSFNSKFVTNVKINDNINLSREIKQSPISSINMVLFININLSLQLKYDILFRIYEIFNLNNKLEVNHKEIINQTARIFDSHQIKDLFDVYNLKEELKSNKHGCCQGCSIY